MATTTAEDPIENVPAAAELAEGGAEPVDGAPSQGTSGETIIIEESVVTGKRSNPTDPADADAQSDAKRAKSDSGEFAQFPTPMDALVTLANDQHQLVVQSDQPTTSETSATTSSASGAGGGATVFDGAAQVIESITELGTSTTSGDIAAQVAAAATAGFTTVVTTTADGSQATSASGVDDGSGGQITLVAINTDDSSQARQQPQQQPEIINQCWFSPKDEKDNPQGIKWKSGMWSKQENEILKRNIDDYLKTNNIASAEEVIFELSKEERKDFYRTIARGITRPLFAVYRRVLRVYDKKNYLGKYTPNEVDKLKELRQKHGNDWAAIGAAMNRSPSSVKDRCRLMRDGGNTGKWSEEEERRLSEAVHEITNTKTAEYVTCSLPWAQVADKVATRTEKQCRSKWLNFLNWKEAGGVEWKKRDEVELIDRIYGLGLDDENDIDWAALSNGWKAVRSPQWLRSKWWALKRQVPEPQNLTFRGMIDYLHANQASVLRNKVEKHETRPRLSTATVQGQQTVMAVPLVSFQGSQGQAFSIPGSKGQVTMVPVAVSQSGMSSATTAVIVNSTDLASAGGGISLEAFLGQQGVDGQTQAFILQTPAGGIGQQTLLFQPQLDQNGGAAGSGSGEQTVITTMPAGGAAVDTEVNLPGATPVEGEGSQMTASGGDGSIVVTGEYASGNQEEGTMVIEQGKQDMSSVVITQDGADVPIVGEEVTTATSILDSSTVEVSIPISSTETTGNEGQ
ncbi:cyclin-D-binding Myb-like transcription factor 1 [Oscarella lobularis]|uniref:cyclin-D-binding Myb-like transcription factor 1 n=1 Tax=Oscarella lobularis TaxID=121494 RepID=UPI0033140423